MSGQIASPTIIQSLASLVSRPVSEAIQERAILHLIDWLGCAIAGSQEAVAKAAMRVRKDYANSNAFYLGVLGNVLEMDDVDKRAILHPAPSIIPAALAMCLEDPERLNRLPEAIVSGYEATIRLGRATGPGHYKLWHTTGTCGSVGAAAACARLLQLSPVETSHALALAMSQASGLWQTRHEPESMGKQLHTANAARAGVDSVNLAAAGFKGPLSILEGQQGFFVACAPEADPEVVLSTYKHDWQIEQVSFKPWAACRHAHAAIDAALELFENGVDLTNVYQVDVDTYSDALTFCDRPDPKSTIEAKFSLQHSVATVLIKGQPEITDFDRPSIDRQDIAETRSKVSVQCGEPYASAYPARYGAQVTIVFQDGSQVSAEAPDALGDPENPLTKAQIHQKAYALMDHSGVEQNQSQQIIDKAESLSSDLLVLIREHLLS
ncbi:MULTISPECIES: MmgE/PrpD family protein [Hyphomonas]|jgi:2-methylcitrate dehydratase PrpD|uniref:MmgE/PrpD family protein n=1 Tax=Hyphomonas TaxID=85 RepID=UPI003513A06C